MPQPAAKKRRVGDEDGPTITDPRFANIQTDPRYRLPGKSHRVKVDQRFAHALKNDDFVRKARVDRYGRAIDSEAERRRLERRFDLGEDSDKESDQPDDDDQVRKELDRINEKRDVLREGRDDSSSEDDSSGGEESDMGEDVEDRPDPAAQHGDVPIGEVSARLAVVNLDWDNIRAEDLMAVFTSFLPATGRLLKVVIYPSEFGKERMEREEMEGPPKEIFSEIGRGTDVDLEEEQEEENEDDIKADIIKPDDGADFDSTALRRYQIDRLRYYYAVLTFSSSETAKSIYDAVDGTEYLSTANFFDLRFVPDNTDFSDDKPREECQSLPMNYKPNDFVTDALQHSKVKLTWDAEDGSRKEAQARAFRGSRKEIDENDLKAYLASDTESDYDADTKDNADMDQDMTAKDDVNGDKLSKKDVERQRMRALLGLAPEPLKQTKDKRGPVGNIQITFSSGLAGPAQEESDSEQKGRLRKNKGKTSVFENSPEPEETTAEKYIRKEKERKQRRKDRMKADKAGDIPIDAAGAIEDVGDDLGFDDPFFAEPVHDKKTAGKLRKEERLKKRKDREAEEAATAKHRAELELLIADDNVRNGATGHTVRHFDMKEIDKAEKEAARKGKKGHKKKASRKDAKEAEEVHQEDDFRVDTTDPRFTGLYEDPEFAIDPTNQRSASDKKGIRAILDERRRRQDSSMLHDEAPTLSTRNGSSKNNGEDQKSDNIVAKRSTMATNSNERRNEVSDLIEKIKRKNTNRKGVLK